MGESPIVSALIRDMKFLKTLWILANVWRFAAAYLLILRSDSGREDCNRWSSILRSRTQCRFLTFADLMLFFPEFRSVVLARIRSRGHGLLYHILKLFAAPLPTLQLDLKHVGGGFYIQHGFCTIVAPRKIGKNCWVNQGVTIGYTNSEDCPTVGDDVTIGAGAKVLGACKVGNHVIIGANCVVVKDVPDGCTVVGCPAFIVKRNGAKVHESL